MAPKKLGLEGYGIERMCDDITSGLGLRQIAENVGVSLTGVIRFMQQPDHVARVKEARALSAMIWDEIAISEIKSAKDAIDIAKARELAHHYRWRASKIAPKEYGDKQQVDLNGNLSFDGMIRAIAEKRTKSSE